VEENNSTPIKRMCLQKGDIKSWGRNNEFYGGNEKTKIIKNNPQTLYHHDAHVIASLQKNKGTII